MKAEAFISRRLSYRGLMVTLSVAVSFFVIVVAVAVSAGFRKEIRNGIASLVGDVRLGGDMGQFTFESPAFLPEDSFVDALSSLPGVTRVEPVVSRPGIVRCGTEIAGVMVKGVESDDTMSLGISIPSTLASQVGLSVGDDMVTWFVDYSSSQGENARTAVRKFHVREIYPQPVRLQESMVVYARIEDMRRLCRYREGEVNALELRTDSSLRNREGYEKVKAAAMSLTYGPEGPDGVRVSSSPDEYPALFDWLDLLDFNVVVVLVLMILVSGFNMISGLLIMMFRNVSVIGTLKSLGMTDRSLAGVFFRVSARKVFTGMIAGNVAAFLFCLIQHYTHVITLNPVNYYVSYVPVSLNLPFLLTAEVVAAAVILLLVCLPVLFVTRVDPAETVRMQ